MITLSQSKIGESHTMKKVVEKCITNWETALLVFFLVIAIPTICLVPKYQMLEYRAGLELVINL